MSRKLWVFYPSPIMVSTINGLIESEAPELECEVIVFPDLLDQAIAEGFTESVRSKVKEAVLAMPEGAGDLFAIQFGIVVLVEQKQLHQCWSRPRHTTDLTGTLGAVDMYSPCRASVATRNTCCSFVRVVNHLPMPWMASA